MEWNVFVVDGPEGKRCLLAPLSHDFVFEAGLPAHAIAGDLRVPAESVMADEPGGLSYEQFDPNPLFARFLQLVLAKHARQCPNLLQQARRQRDGYVYILDARTPTPQGQVPPEDVLGRVEVRNGEAVAYQGSHKYEPLGRNGLMRLDPWLEARFMDELLLQAGRASS